MYTQYIYAVQFFVCGDCGNALQCQSNVLKCDIHTCPLPSNPAHTDRSPSLSIWYPEGFISSEPKTNLKKTLWERYWVNFMCAVIKSH